MCTGPERARAREYSYPPSHLPCSLIIHIHGRYSTCVIHNYQGPMPLAKASVPYNRKRQQSAADPEPDCSPQPTAKRQKLKDSRRHRTPSSFWDNLSRQWLTHRTLRELDRRTLRPTVPIPPCPNGKENINPAKLKHFARHGGPNLGDLRGVSSIQPFIK